MTENNVHHGADTAPEHTTFRVRATDGTIVLSPAPAIEEDGYLEITLGNRSDHRLNVTLTRNENECFWRINLPDHDGAADSTVEMQNEICRLVLRATSLCLMLNSGSIGGRA